MTYSSQCLSPRVSKPCTQRHLGMHPSRTGVRQQVLDLSDSFTMFSAKVRSSVAKDLPSSNSGRQRNQKQSTRPVHSPSTPSPGSSDVCRHRSFRSLRSCSTSSSSRSASLRVTWFRRLLCFVPCLSTPCAGCHAKIAAPFRSLLGPYPSTTSTAGKKNTLHFLWIGSIPNVFNTSANCNNDVEPLTTTRVVHH